MDIREAAPTNPNPNNDYGKGLADSIAANVEKRGGTITRSAPHEEGKGESVRASLLRYVCCADMPAPVPVVLRFRRGVLHIVPYAP